jgi:hypothetical protein
MKILKQILMGLGAIIAVLLIGGLFTAKSYTLQREVIVNKPKHHVFDYVRMLKNQNEFSEWYRMDPTSKTAVTGTDGTVGSIYSWDSEKVGKGEQETKAIKECESIDYELRFLKPFKGRADNKVTFESVSENQTKIKSVFNSSMPYPMNVMRWFMSLESTIGEPIGASLNHIKENLEKQ